MKRHLVLYSLLLVGVAALTLVGSTFLHLEIPEPSGVFVVGRTSVLWSDDSRPEEHTADPEDKRSVPLTVWYPAQAGTGEPGGYIDGLDDIGSGLVASGELASLEVWGIGLVRHNVWQRADVADNESHYPTVLLSPGNATNAGFYASIAVELASNGYIVIGIDHPYQVASTLISGGGVAVYDGRGDVAPLDQRQAITAAKIQERVEDLRFVVGRLGDADAVGQLLAGRMDLSHLMVMGHSNGGVTASESCGSMPGLKACLNIDGQLAGGPFSARPDGRAPEQPFMYLTKERALHPEIISRFEERGEGAYLVSIPSASHESFTDGAILAPTINPLTGDSHRIMATTRTMVLSFFDQIVDQGRVTAFPNDVPDTEIYVNIFPLGDNPPLPAD